jgi:ankyrin repeat protein/cell wall assembly regulator SMI1
MDNPIRRPALPTNHADVAAFERQLGFEIPEEYRAFLLAHNGGVPQRNTFTYVNSQGQRRDGWVSRFLSLGRAGLIDPDASDLELAYRERPPGLAAGVVPVAEANIGINSALVCVACTGPDAGKVWLRPYVEPLKDTLHAVADSWNDFFGKMRYEDGKPIAWKLALQKGDVAALRKWLEEHPKHWRDDRAYSLDIERTAVQENHWPALVVLMEFGFEPSSLFEEALSYHRYDLAHQLLQTGKVGKRMIRECLAGAPPLLYHLPPLLQELVAAGADVNHETESGNTPLHRAVEARSDNGIRFLLQRGADPTVKNDEGRTPLGLAQRLEEPKLAEILRDAEQAWKKRPVDKGPAVVDFDWCGVEITETGPALTLADIEAFEQEIGLSFPPEYRALLLKANGGVPRPNVLPAPWGSGDDNDEGAVENMDDDGTEPQLEFLPLRRGQERMRHVEGLGTSVPGNSVETAREWFHDGTEIPRGKVPIGWIEHWRYEGAWLLLGCKGQDRGKLFACYYGTESLRLTLPGLFELLGKSKAPPDSPGERLMASLAARDLTGVRAALADGAAELLQTKKGQKILERACELDFDDGAMALVEAGAKAGALFRIAATRGRLTLVRRLLAHRKGPSKKLLAEVLTYNPALFGDVELLRQFAAHGLEFDKLFRQTPHQVACAAASGSVEGLRFALEHGADPHRRDEHQGSTLLHQAAMARLGDAAAVVRYLLGLGVKANQPDCSGCTALHMAVLVGNLEAAKALIDAGEDLHARHPRSVPGMNLEQSAAHMERVRKMMGGGLNELLQHFGMDVEDAPPPPDTSTPQGEQLAKLMETFAHKKKQIMERLTARTPVGLGQGESAAEMAAQSPEGRAILPALEAYASSRRSAAGGAR